MTLAVAAVVEGVDEDAAAGASSSSDFPHGHMKGNKWEAAKFVVK